VTAPPPLEWTPSLAVGDPDIDDQHRELFRRAARLITALRGGDRAQVPATLAYLEAYVVHHFEGEERLMRELAYPGLAEHAAEHRAFRHEFAVMAADFESRGPTALVALTLHNRLSAWLREHLGGVDLALGRFLAARRGR
jgi:hemerythrin